MWILFTAGRTASPSYNLEADDYAAAFKQARRMFPHLHSSCIRIERAK